MLAALTLVPSAFAAGPYTKNTAGPNTGDGIQPSYHSGNLTSCPSNLTAIVNTSDTGPGNQSINYSGGGVSFVTTITNGTFLSFTQTGLSSFTVYIKGGPAFDQYDYPLGNGSDTNLHSPVNNGGNIATISHYLVCGTLAPHPTLYLGYADGFRPGTPSENPGAPWPTSGQSTSTVTFVGCNYFSPDRCPTGDVYDAGAIRFDNTSSQPMTFSAASVAIGTGCTFAPWPGLDATIQPGDSLILTQTGGLPPTGCKEGTVNNDNFDTSDVDSSISSCPTNPSAPVISITVDGSAVTYTDTAKLLTTGGKDKGSAACNASGKGSNETTAWVLQS